jgi:hypothetical protein
MIIHRHEDGTEGYMFHEGDMVIVRLEHPDQHPEFYKEGAWGRVVLRDSKDRKNGHGTLISFVDIVDTERDNRWAGTGIPTWDLYPMTETYRNAQVVNCLRGKPVDEILLNIL